MGIKIKKSSSTGGTKRKSSNKSPGKANATCVGTSAKKLKTEKTKTNEKIASAGGGEPLKESFKDEKQVKSESATEKCKPEISKLENIEGGAFKAEEAILNKTKNLDDVSQGLKAEAKQEISICDLTTD